MLRALTVVLAILAAGCMGRAPEAPPTLESAANASNVSRETLPEGREGTFLAFNETNATEEGVGGLDHRHDLWQGRERVTLFEGTVNLTVPVCCGTPSASPYADVPLPPGALVYEGTGSVEVTFSDPQRRVCCGLRVPESGPTDVHLLYRDAVASGFEDAGQADWGKAFVIPIADAERTDMPHATATLWAFRAASDDATDGSLSFGVRIDIVRAPGEIPLWPGHPDLYAAGHERVVLQAHVKGSSTGLSSILGNESLPPFTPAQKLIGHGTRTLFVWANVTRLDAPNPVEKPTYWILSFHNATGENYTDPGRANATTAWTLKVGPDGMDSPYATASRWGFRLMDAVHEPVTGTRCYFGCSKYEVEYDITVVAADYALDAYDGEA